MELEILKNATITGNILKLPPGQLDRDTYMKVAKKIEGIGGKWKGGKVSGFVFSSDPTDLLNEILNGSKINLKKDFQFFPTPPGLADELVNLVEIESYHTVLEPSAGQGAIIKAIHDVYPKHLVHYCELMENNLKVLAGLKNTAKVGTDFLEYIPPFKFDVIIANPPFTKNQDIDHIKHMYSMLNDNGSIITIASNHWRYCGNKKELEFFKWLQRIDAKIDNIEAGTFKESGTNVSCCIIQIRK